MTAFYDCCCAVFARYFLYYVSLTTLHTDITTSIIAKAKLILPTLHSELA